MAPSRHDWKIVDWDVKPQHNQPTNLSLEVLCVKSEEQGLENCLNHILQKVEVNIWKQWTALLALMQLLAVPYNRYEQ